jgi:hypothetical protein
LFMAFSHRTVVLHRQRRACAAFQRRLGGRLEE